MSISSRFKTHSPICDHHWNQRTYTHVPLPAAWSRLQWRTTDERDEWKAKWKNSEGPRYRQGAGLDDLMPRQKRSDSAPLMSEACLDGIAELRCSFVDRNGHAKSRSLSVPVLTLSVQPPRILADKCYPSRDQSRRTPSRPIPHTTHSARSDSEPLQLNQHQAIHWQPATLPHLTSNKLSNPTCLCLGCISAALSLLRP